MTIPFNKPGALDSEAYWAVITFMLDATALLPESTELGPDNAEEVSLRRD